MNLFNRLARLFTNSRLVLKIHRKFKYPRISIAYDVKLDVIGFLNYGDNCSFGVGSNIFIPKNATLKMGDNCYVGRNVELGPSGYIQIGNQTSIQDRSIILGDVSIGAYCSIAPNVYISSGKHYYDLNPLMLIKDQDEMVSKDENLSFSHSKPVVIGEDCWLGINVVVMAGVEIGKGVVVGANSVVTKNIEPYSVVAGAPAKVIKKRLNFEPPKSIVFNNQNDWPFFYSGFAISKASLQEYSQFGGIRAFQEFVICLDASSGDSIHLTAKNISSQICEVIYGDQRKIISNQFQEIVFKINEFSRKKNNFCMQIPTNNTVLIIEKVWLS